MLQIRREAVYTKLDPIPFRALQSAFELARARGSAYVELAHWLNQILMLPDSDLHRIAVAFDIDLARLTADLSRALERIRKGGTDLPDFSEHVDRAIERGWIVASLAFGAGRVRSGHLILGILDESDLTRVLLALSERFRELERDRLARQLASIVKGSPEGEAGTEAIAPTGTRAAGALPSAPLANAEALLRFTHDMTEQASTGGIDPVIGRDEEIRQVVDVLLRRRQNNPILVGEAGVGKTAIVEGLAARLIAGDVPPSLKGVSLKALDLGLLQAGASMRGEFEDRLKSVIDDIQSSPTPIILFIDEAHTLIGAGGAAGTGDAANMLKPALARGTLRTIAATTWAEYKRFIEPDAALTRRFEAVRVEQPTFDQALNMMRGIAPALESHHHVRLRDDALHAAVGLSQRYLPARQLPDKAVSVLDTSCARVAASQAAVPPQLARCRQRIAAVEAEHALLEREASLGREVGSRLRELAAALEEEQARATELEERWARERELVQRIVALGDEALAPAAGASDRVAPLKELDAELARLQGERPMVLAEVDAEAVATVIAGWTGIPVGRMVKDEIDAVLGLAGTLKRRIVGQDHALEMISRRIQTSRAGLENPQKPIGVFLLCGPSGVGKTETALALADALYGGEQNIVSINMSEFQEAHTVSTLKGAPPGYVGYGQGGRLTEAVRRQPYGLVLLDEIEKAHPDVHEIFFQIFDKGLVEDSEGRRIDFKNTLILMTSNVGSELIADSCNDREIVPDPEQLIEALYPRLLRAFPAALLGRLAVIPYYPLTEDALTGIIRLQLDRVRRRIEDRHKVQVRLEEPVLDLVRQRCTEVESGGRMVDAILSNTVLPEVSRGILERLKDGRAFREVRIGTADHGFAYSFG
jgi:type VI secretion system protein VasG